jgi:hypothetical protein
MDVEGVIAGHCLELCDSKGPMATLGHHQGGGPEDLWICGWLRVDLEELNRQDSDGEWVGDLKAGDTLVEITGSAISALEGDCLARIDVVVHMAMVFIDPLLDINAVMTFVLVEAFASASMTGVGAVLSIHGTVTELMRMSNGDGKSVFQFLKVIANKSWYGGDLSRDFMLLKVWNVYDHCLVHTVVAYGFIKESNFGWTWSTLLVVMSIIITGPCELQWCCDGWHEHFCQSSRCKFVRSAPGERFRKLVKRVNALGNPLLMTAVLATALYNYIPEVKGAELENDVKRWFWFGVLTACVSSSWLFLCIALPWRIFGGAWTPPENLKVIDLLVCMMECNVHGEAPVHTKRNDWTAKFHVYKMVVPFLWKVLMCLMAWTVVPGADSFFGDMLKVSCSGRASVKDMLETASSETASVEMLEQTASSETCSITPRQVIVYAWMAASALCPVLHLIMIAVAQCSSVYPGLRFGSRMWPVHCPSAHQTLARIAVCPFGVLGDQLTDGKYENNAPKPSPDIAFVDPAGLPYITNEGPKGATGASGAIYSWLGIRNDPSFPEQVRSAIKEPLQAKFHAYGEKKCIHVVGPDFSDRKCTREVAVAELVQAYRNVLAQFAVSGLPSLRLLPISGGIFAGPFANEFPDMTAEAVQSSLGLLTIKEKRRILCAKRLEMCIFMGNDLQSFQEAFCSAVAQTTTSFQLMQLANRTSSAASSP